MTVYCGVDFHARQQTIRYCDTADGEIHSRELDHQKDDLRSFYSQFTGEALLGWRPAGIAPGSKSWWRVSPSSLAWRCGGDSPSCSAQTARMTGAMLS